MDLTIVNTERHSLPKKIKGVIMKNELKLFIFVYVLFCSTFLSVNELQAQNGRSLVNAPDARQAGHIFTPQTGVGVNFGGGQTSVQASDTRLGKPFLDPNATLVSLPIGNRKMEIGPPNFTDKIRTQILERLPAFALPKESLMAAVRIFMDEKGNVKKVISRGSSGNQQLDDALVKATYEIGFFGELPKDKIKEAKTTGVIIVFVF